MRQPVCKFHSVVTALRASSLIILVAGASAFSTRAQESALGPPATGGVLTNADDIAELSQGNGVAASPGGVTAINPDSELLDRLFSELAQIDGEGWRQAESDIMRIWSRSGSAAMDLLYQRGEGALDAGDLDSAIGHLTALTDHAPEFAAGWQMRAVAYYFDGKFGPALEDLARTLELEPRHFGALTQLGAMLEELGADQRALRAYRLSLEINPHQQEASDAVLRLEQKTAGTAA